MRTKEHKEKPSFLSFIGENINVWFAMWRSHKFRKSYPFTPKGDGHPVLVVPGFMASDLSASSLRKFIKAQGYTPYGWNLGRNYGNISELNTLLAQIETLHAKHGTPVSLIGWSLGGVYARQLAKEKPELIRQVITLASPFADIERPNNATWLYKLINDRRPIAPADEKWLIDLPGPAPVPSTALYSKEDGVVPWPACMEPIVDEWHQNIEVTGGHLGMGYNPATLVVVADRLQLTKTNWKPFEPKNNYSEFVVFPQATR